MCATMGKLHGCSMNFSSEIQYIDNWLWTQHKFRDSVWNSHHKILPWQLKLDTIMPPYHRNAYDDRCGCWQSVQVRVFYNIYYIKPVVKNLLFTKNKSIQSGKQWILAWSAFVRPLSDEDPRASSNKCHSAYAVQVCGLFSRLVSGNQPEVIFQNYKGRFFFWPRAVYVLYSSHPIVRSIL